MRRMISFGLAVALLVGCGHPQDPATIPRDSYPDGRAFERSIKQYPYKATTERAARIIAGVKKLHRCMTKDEVSALLGAPDFSEIAYGPKGPNARWQGSWWMFFVSKRSHMMNMQDPMVEVFYDTTDRAHWIVAHGIEGASEIGSAEVPCTEIRLT